MKELIKQSMRIRREVVITSASRMYTGPEVGQTSRLLVRRCYQVFGCRPVLVVFEDFKDREEVLANSK